MNKVTLEFPNAGENKIHGYCGRMIDYTIEKQLMDTETWALFVNQFRLKSDGEDLGWRGEFWGKMMRGASLTYRATKNEKLYSVMVDTVRDMLSTQGEDGYFSTYTSDKEFKAWNLWVAKYVMLGMMYFLDICRNKALSGQIVRALKRHADYIIEHIGEGEGQIGIFETSGVVGAMNSCSILEPFVKLYVLTGEPKYLEFAAYLVDSGLCKDADIIKLCISGELYPYQFPQIKAYEMTSCFEGLLEYYKVTGNPDHLRAVENFVDMVIESDYTIIGCSGCTHELFDNSSVKQTFPAPSEVMQETCVTVTFMKLCAKLLALTGDAKYAACIERSGLNALYGAVNNENQTMHRTVGRAWYWTDQTALLKEPFPFDSYSPLFQGRRGLRAGGFQPLQNGRAYGCCACIGSAGTAIMSLFAVMKGADGVYVNLYNDTYFSTEAFGDKISIAVYANPYRYHNGAKISVKGGGQAFALALRIPAWAEEFAVFVNGEEVQGEERNGYFVLHRVWEQDKVELRFKTPVKMTVLNQKAAFTQGPITLARDCRLDDITKPLDIDAVDGRSICAKRVQNTAFSSNVTYEIRTKDGVITLCDYAQAGKNYDDECSSITVWQELAMTK